MTEHTLVVSSADLASLLRDVKRAASADDTLPVIAGVMLYVAQKDGAPVLTASATDRFSALYGHIRAAVTLPGRLWLTNRQVAQVITSVRPFTSRKRAAVSQVEIRIVDGMVTFRQLALDDLADVAVTFKASERRNFPDLSNLIEKARAREGSGDPCHIDGRRLAVLAQIAADRRENLRIRMTGHASPVIAQVGVDLVGILMPARVGSESETALDVPVFPLPVLDEMGQEAAA
jgi:hypothetical protein